MSLGFAASVRQAFKARDLPALSSVLQALRAWQEHEPCDRDLCEAAQNLSRCTCWPVTAPSLNGLMLI